MNPTIPLLAPPLTPADALPEALRERGYGVIDAASLAALSGNRLSELEGLAAPWSTLPPDDFLRDGGRYRRRRHASLVVEQRAIKLQAHRAHWQPVAYNALHGGIERWFAPIEADWLAQPAWQRLLLALCGVLDTVKPGPRWYVEAHQFRIDTTDGIGRPTPEGAHRDGVDFVIVMLVGRQGIKGGETRVFEVDGPHGVRFTLLHPWTAMFIDDTRVIHESTPIQPSAPDTAGHRDTLVLTFRRVGFLDAQPEQA